MISQIWKGYLDASHINCFSQGLPEYVFPCPALSFNPLLGLLSFLWVQVNVTSSKRLFPNTLLSFSTSGLVIHSKLRTNCVYFIYTSAYIWLVFLSSPPSFPSSDYKSHETRALLVWLFPLLYSQGLPQWHIAHNWWSMGVCWIIINNMIIIL